MVHRFGPSRFTVGVAPLLFVLLSLLILTFPYITNASFAKTIANADPTYPVWVAQEPFGGPVQLIRFAPSNPEVVYAFAPATGFYGSNGGLYRSNNGGHNWTYIGFEKANITALVIDPQDPNTLYITKNTPVYAYRSRDGGAHWQPLSFTIGSIATDPAISGTLVASITEETSSGIYKSYDFGASWSLISTPNFAVDNIIIDPHNSTILYGTHEHDVYKSTDGGRTWGVVFSENSIRIITLGISALNPNLLYLYTTNKIVYISTNGGVNWTSVTMPSTIPIDRYTIEEIVASPEDEDILYVLFRYYDRVFEIDQGILYKWNWHGDAASLVTTLEPLRVTTLAVNLLNANNILVGTTRGIFQTEDEGTTWVSSTNGIANLAITTLTADPSTPDTLYLAAQSAGLYKSMDSGETWVSLEAFPLKDITFNWIAIDPRQPNLVYAAPLTQEVYKSNDAGLTWTRIAEFSDVSSFAYAFSNTPEGDSSVLYIGTSDGTYYSEDEGTTWTELGDTQFVTDIFISQDATMTAISDLATAYDGRLLVSHDSGTTWTRATGLPCGVIPNPREGDIPYCAQITDVAVNHTDPNLLYAVTNEGIYTSHDGGLTWSVWQNTPAFRDATFIRTYPESPNTFHVGTNSHGLLMSHDAGITWQTFSAGLGHRSIYSLIYSPTTDKIHLATSGGLFTQSYWYTTYLPAINH